MNCRDMETRIALDVGRDLPEAEAAAVREHLADCAACRALAQELARSQQALETLRDEAFDERTLAAWRARLLERVEAGEPRRAFRHAWMWAAAAAAALLIVLAVGRYRQPMPEPLQPAPVVARMTPPPVAPPPAPVVPRRPRLLRRRAPKQAPPAKPAEPLLVRFETSDPDVVIYWIVESKGD